MIFKQCELCKHYGSNGRNTCLAFPVGIPVELLDFPIMESTEYCLEHFGYNPVEHNKVLPGQVGDYVFEEEDEAED